MKKLFYFVCGGVCTLGMIAYGVNMYNMGKEVAREEIEGNSDKEKSE